MKTLKFAKHLIPLVLSGEKTTTWRLFDDKNLSAGDEVEFLESGNNRRIAIAKLTKVYEKTFATLNEVDLKGHENFSSTEDMYEHYRTYYNCEVKPDTSLKIINFELITKQSL